MDPFGLNNLSKKLELLAGFSTGEEKYSLGLNPKSTDSWWNHKSKKVQVGVEEFSDLDLPQMAELIAWHKVGHIKFTGRDINLKELGFPFSILNILEDARIEAKMEKDFSPLAASSYQRYYLDKEMGTPELFKNPFNIGILKRWRLWGVETKTSQPESLTGDQYKEFLSDWDSAIENSIKSEFPMVIATAKFIYEKWQWLFDENKTPDEMPTGGVEKSASSGSGSGVEPSPSGDELKSVENCFTSIDDFDWDMPYIQDQTKALRKILDFKVQEEKSYGISGRRISPARIENPPLLPFKNKLLTSRKIKIKKLLIVLDGSGSMKYGPFESAAHISYILSLVFESDILITTDKAEKPIKIPFKEIDKLKRFGSWGGTENYESVSFPTAYSFVLFLTDAVVCDEDKEYVRKLSKVCKVGAGYVGNIKYKLTDVFNRNFYDTELSTGTARMIGLFLKRYFTAVK